jgi:hypothetical protein
VADICLAVRIASGDSSSRLGARQPDELRILVEWDAHRTGLLGERLEDGLAHPPHGVGNELHALVGIELANGLEQALVPDRHEFTQVESVALVLLHVRDHESEIRGDQPLGCFLVTFLSPACQPSLFLRVVDEGEFLDVLQVLVESRGGRRAEVSLGPGFGHLLHTRPYH